jgi:peptidoglycan/xylan/chitin deacetylase (PgdA/CDA1 family)
MRTTKDGIINAGFAFFRATGLHRGLAPLTRGLGAILTLHHVRPRRPDAFEPNRLLEIEPDFLEAALGRMASLGLDFVSLDEALRRLGQPGERRFVALTFDDGYRDLIDHALPILERHRVPFAAFITTGYAERTAQLWWLELEHAVRHLDEIVATLGGSELRLSCASPEAKGEAFRTLYALLRGGPEDRLREVCATLAVQAGLQPGALAAHLCLDWEGVRRLARHPLCTIGAHTLTHPMLAKHDAAVMRRELAEGRARIEAQIGLPVRHVSYPVGDASSAGTREFAAAAALGFCGGVTTRPGMLFADHRATPTALPRLSLNGLWQDLDNLEILLSGVPFALWNKGRRVA